MNTFLSTIRAKAFGGRVLLFMLACSGAVLWIVSGIILAVAPAGKPPVTFRGAVIDVQMLLAIGLLLISLSLGLLVLFVGSVRSRKLTAACLVTITAGVVYVLGRLVRDAFLQGTGWEPLLPLGFLLCIGGLSSMGIISFRRKAVPAPVSMLLMVMAVFLLFFNDQYLPVMAVPFGLSVMALSALLALPPKQQ